MSKRVAILFSGGLDSTYLIYKNLKEGNYVEPFYINIKNNDIKTKLELNRSELLIDLFKKEYPTQISSLNVGVEILVNHTYDSTLKYVQMPIWILSLLYCAKTTTDEFQLGYVCGDDMVSYIDDIQNIYKSYSAILKKEIKLSFPLIKLSKYDFLEELPEKYFKLTCTCEAPILNEKTIDSDLIEFTPCCECDPCKKIILHYLNHGYGELYNKPYYEKVVNNLLYNTRYIDNDLSELLTSYNQNKYCVCDKSPEPYQLELPFENELYYNPEKWLANPEKEDYLCKSISKK